MKCNTIPELERFLLIQEQALGSASPEVATTISKLAELYFGEGDLDKAEDLYQKAFAIRSNLHGLNRQGIEQTEQRLKEIRLAKAGLSADSCDTASNLLAPEAAALSTEPETLADPGAVRADVPPSSVQRNAQNSLASNTSTRSINAAIADTELELELLIQMVGNEHTSVADLLTKLADLYCRVRMYNKMEPLLVDALKIRELACGAEHPSVATELKNLGTLYCAQERYALAEPLLKRAIGLRERAYGAMHPRVADVEAQYAQLLRKTNRVALAEALERHVSEIRNGHDSSPLFSCDSSLFGAAKPRR